MDVFEIVKTMLAVRDYTDQPIVDETLHKILEAGRMTASRKNLQPWHLVVVQDKVLLAQLADLAPSGDYIRRAALAIAVFLDNDQPVTMTDGARAVQSMMLVAWGEGIGSNWVGWLKREEIKELLDTPADYHLLTVLSFGYPAHHGQARFKRRTWKHTPTPGLATSWSRGVICRRTLDRPMALLRKAPRGHHSFVRAASLRSSLWPRRIGSNGTKTYV